MGGYAELRVGMTDDPFVNKDFRVIYNLRYGSKLDTSWMRTGRDFKPSEMEYAMAGVSLLLEKTRDIKVVNGRPVTDPEDHPNRVKTIALPQSRVDMLKGYFSRFGLREKTD